MRGGLRSIFGLTALLVGVDFLDELSSGVPFVASPDVQRAFGVSYGQAAGWLLTAVGALAVVLEPPLLLVSERFPRRWFVCGGLGALGAICLLAAAAPSYGWLVVALLLFGPASGVGVGLSQATLMDAHPERREQMMVRWTLAGALGDLAAPGFLALCAFLGGGFRLGFAVVGATLALYAALLWTRPFPARPGAPEDGSPAPGLRARLRSAAGRRSFLAWGGAVLLCGLMDEILVAFGALFLRDRVGADVGERAAILTALMVGAGLGLPVADRLLRRAPPRRLLAASALLAGLFFAAWLRARTPLASGALLFATGFFASMHYPLAKAQAYRALPESSATVNALLTAGGALMLPVPLLLGLVADGPGLAFALGLLLLQPLGLLAAALLAPAPGAGR